MVILLGFTTTNAWEGKIEEINLLGITRLSLFLTGLEPRDREELYKRLERTCLERISHVHLRSDSSPEELDYLIERFKTRVFNIHPKSQFVLKYDLSKYRDKIYVENAGRLANDEYLNYFAGLCLDFSHWEDIILVKGKEYDPEKDDLVKLVKRFPVGCCHISAVGSIPQISSVTRKMEYSNHRFTNLKQFDYVTKFRGLFPWYVCLELENSFEEQLRAKGYIESLQKTL